MLWSIPRKTSSISRVFPPFSVRLRYHDGAAGLTGVQILKEKLSNWRDGPEPAGIPHGLIARYNEMKPLYAELAEKGINNLQLWGLLEQCIFAGAYATDGYHKALCAEHGELQELCEEISRTAVHFRCGIHRRSVPDQHGINASTSSRGRVTLSCSSPGMHPGAGDGRDHNLWTSVHSVSNVFS